MRLIKENKVAAWKPCKSLEFRSAEEEVRCALALIAMFDPMPLHPAMQTVVHCHTLVRQRRFKARL